MTFHSPAHPRFTSELDAIRERELEQRQNLWDRLMYLRDLGRQDLSLARLVEGHLDARSILLEAARPIEPKAKYAIWASGGSASTVALVGSEPRRLEGQKPFCTGADLVNRALVFIDDVGLLEIDMDELLPYLRFERESWKVEAFAATHTYTVHFDAAPLDEDALLKLRSDWYFERAGFWHGALCPAACWAGGARRLVEDAQSRVNTSAHARAHVGAMMALDYSAQCLLRQGALAAGRDPNNESRSAYPRALAIRHGIERACTEIVERHGRAFGPRPLAFESELASHIAELRLYLRQCHAERDLEELGHQRLPDLD